MTKLFVGQTQLHRVCQLAEAVWLYVFMIAFPASLLQKCFYKFL